MPFFLRASSKSSQGANTRSHERLGTAFTASYRIRRPRFDMPISYTSGYESTILRSTGPLFANRVVFVPDVAGGFFAREGENRAAFPRSIEEALKTINATNLLISMFMRSDVAAKQVIRKEPP